MKIVPQYFSPTPRAKDVLKKKNKNERNSKFDTIRGKLRVRVFFFGDTLDFLFSRRFDIPASCFMHLF